MPGEFISQDTFPLLSQGVHGNRLREGLILPSSGEKKKSRTQEMSQKMSQSKGEARPRVQVGQLGGWSLRKTLRRKAVCVLYIVKADQLSPGDGRIPQAGGSWAPPFATGGRGRDSRASGSWPCFLL